MATKFSATLSVRSYELDSFGHVNNAVYLQYLEYARCEYMARQGLTFNDFHAWGAFPYVVHVDIDYKASSRTGNVLEVIGWVSHWGRSSFVLSYEIYNRTTSKLSALANVKFAWVDDQERIITLPSLFKEKMA